MPGTFRTYISEPDRGRQSWTNQEAKRDAVYANRRRIRGARGKRLLRRRGELLERPCAHLYETGGLRRTYVRGQENVLNRLLVHAGAFNLGLLMRRFFGIGTPRALQGHVITLRAVFSLLWTWINEALEPIWTQGRSRMIPGKDAPFVLDFVNDAQNIYRAFKPYYDKTELAETSDPSMLDRLKHELDEAQVYYWSEVEAFAHVFYKPMERQGAADHAHMQRHLQPAVDRFKAIADEAKREEFREKLSGYVRVYAFLSQIVPYADPDLEMLYSYGRFLLPHLPLDRDLSVVQVGDEVALQYYRLDRTYSGAIMVREGPAQYVATPSEVGTGKAKEEKAPLSEIIEALNERFGTQFSEEDRLFFQQIKERACRSDQVVRTALANPLDKFELGIRKLIEDLMIERMGENDKIVTRYMADQDFQGTAFPILAREIFEAVRSRASRADSSQENDRADSAKS